MDKTASMIIALVPVIDGQPQLPIFVGTEEGAQQYWEDNPLNFLNRRVDTWDVCPCCLSAHPKLTHQLYNYSVCENCYTDYHEPSLEPCEYCRAGTYNGVHDSGVTLCEECATKVDNLLPEPCPISGDPCSIQLTHGCDDCGLYADYIADYAENDEVKKCDNCSAPHCNDINMCGACLIIEPDIDDLPF